MKGKLPSREHKVAHVRTPSSTSRYVLLLDVPSGRKVWEPTTDYLARPRQVPATIGGITIDVCAFDVISGPLAGVCVRVSSERKIGLGLTLREYNTYPVLHNNVGEIENRGSFMPFGAGVHEPAWWYKENTSKNTVVLIDIGGDCDNGKIEAIVDSMYCNGYLPSSVRRYLSADFCQHMSNVAPRAWDTHTAPTQNHMFTAKVDGERCWLLFHGNVVYHCNARFSSTVTRWMWCWTASSNIVTNAVVDCEYVAGIGYYVIDILQTVSGAIAPLQRDIPWVQEEFSRINQVWPESPILIRQYFDTAMHATAYAESMPAPTDGLVAIRNGSTETLKVKPIKSIELELAEGGVLSTSDGVTVAKIQDGHRYAVGDIVEVRFTIDPASDNVVVHDVFERTDKRKANDASAVSNVFATASASITPDDSERRAALLWCNSLRSHVHMLARTYKSCNSIIIDVGTGDGQSIDSISFDESHAYILVEPDKRKCRRLQQRIRDCRLVSTGSELAQQLRQLVTRTVWKVVANCTLQQLLDSDEFVSTIIPEVKCVTATYSCHFVVDALEDMHRAYSIPVFGCTYVYDGSVDGVLIDTAGVSMKNKDGIGVVRWGGDRVYNEPATRLADYSAIGATLYGRDLLQLPSHHISPSARSICSHVAVILP